MKYGKEFQQILNDSAFPDDWKSSAIEYGQLKKLIKSVVAELSSMGLSRDVLHRLLVSEEDNSPSPDRSRSPPNTKTDTEGTEDDVLEFEFESDEASPTLDGMSPKTRAKRVKEVMLDPILDSDADHHHLSASPEAGPSSMPMSNHHRKFRVRLLSNGHPAPNAISESPRPMSVMDMMATGEGSGTASGSWRSEAPVGAGRRKSKVKRARLDSHGGAKAEYVLTGDPDRPVPQLRLHLPLAASPVISHQPVFADDIDAEGDVDSSDDETPFFPLDDITRPPRDLPKIDIIPPSPSLSRLQSAKSPIWALTSGAGLATELEDLRLEDPAIADDLEEIEEIESVPTAGLQTGTGSDRPVTPDREFIIPLASDIAFFNLLTAALTSLSAFHSAQQLAFKAAVEKLCLMISQSIQPSSNPVQVVATPFTPSPQPIETEPDSRVARMQRNARASKKDLYAWREIFTLWIESEIFESSAERTRGERTVEQAEARLQMFADMVVKRGLGDRRTMRGKKVREAWEEFLRLNVLLLDIKRFQIANINAARKILKKHDKRTALTASAGFPDFVRSTLSAHVDKDGNISTWTFYNTSLPHVLLASLTDTLLPILPSLDDYACLICTSIAFKPIRLACGHLFCVRCLVKMQRAGKAECPLCRSKVVLLADKNSLDMAVLTFMKEWFPKEVKEKQRENEVEIATEQGLVPPADPKCVIM